MHRSKILASLLALTLLTAGAAFGQTDFTRYVAFGDSLTAGYSSSALARTYQVNSYPALIYRQATGQTTGFEQPLISDPGISGLQICNGPNPPAPCGILRLVSLGVSPVIAPTPGRGTPLNLTLGRPYNNIAVPGATVHDLVATRNGGFHDVILRNTNPAQGFTQLQQGLSLRPTFATLWIGNNDVLGAATSGIVVEGVTLTPVDRFEADYRTAANAIAASGAKMAIANIPDVTSIPFVTTVSRFIPNPQTGQPVLVNGQPVPLIGPNGPLQAGDFVLLTATSELSQGRGIPAALGGSGLPLSDSSVLSASEAATIRARVNAFNTIIRNVANEKGAAFVDINAILTDLAAHGLNIGGVTYSSAFLTGGVFSYDGVHPTAFGYAYIANLFIDAINDKFNDDIPFVNLYPFVFGTSTGASTASLSVDKSFDESVASQFTDFVFTSDARRSLLLSLNVPKWIVEGTKPTRPRNPRRGGHN
ncbi:MAG TPA: SGNH/GDSL hydrolase family protein [Thermoanaerobaculia bacterium]|jgi:lysophospholipase L1-like esterase|nr:SGNH/GDSL hydrolase family protein [Thermoanaerobaculia bacterium]